jgi:hypothetical protein
MDQTGGYRKWIEALEGSHRDIDPVGECPRRNSMLSESGWGMFVGGQGSCLAQERAQSRRKANGYYGVVPTAGTAVSRLDNLKMCKLKKKV